jgi:hypothetical protein
LDHWTGKDRLPAAEAAVLAERSEAVNRVFKKMIALKAICGKYEAPFPFLEMLSGKSQYEVPVGIQRKIASSSTKKPSPAVSIPDAVGAAPLQDSHKDVDPVLTENESPSSQFTFERSLTNIVVWWTPQICFYIGVFLAYRFFLIMDSSSS